MEDEEIEGKENSIAPAMVVMVAGVQRGKKEEEDGAVTVVTVVTVVVVEGGRRAAVGGGEGGGQRAANAAETCKPGMAAEAKLRPHTRRRFREIRKEKRAERREKRTCPVV